MTEGVPETVSVRGFLENVSATVPPAGFKAENATLTCFVEARLIGAGFTIAPEGWSDQTFLTTGEVSWTWSVIPEKAGLQNLAIQIHGVVVDGRDGTRVPSGGRTFLAIIQVDAAPNTALKTASKDVSKRVSGWFSGIVKVVSGLTAMLTLVVMWRRLKKGNTSARNRQRRSPPLHQVNGPTTKSNGPVIDLRDAPARNTEPGDLHGSAPPATTAAENAEHATREGDGVLPYQWQRLVGLEAATSNVRSERASAAPDIDRISDLNPAERPWSRAVVPRTPAVDSAHKAVKRAADLIVAGDLRAARTVLDDAYDGTLLNRYKSAISTSRWDVQRPPTTGKRGKGPASSVLRQVYERDRWHCRYCGIPALAPNVPARLATLLGRDLWSPGDDNKHPALLNLRACIDHVMPATLLRTDGTDPHDIGNLVTACWPCNFAKDAFLCEQIRVIDPRTERFAPEEPDWDGLRRILTSPI